MCGLGGDTWTHAWRAHVGYGGHEGLTGQSLRALTLSHPQGTPADVLYKGTITRIVGEDSPSRLDRSREDSLPKGHVIYEGKKGHILSYEGEFCPHPAGCLREGGPGPGEECLAQGETGQGDTRQRVWSGGDFPGPAGCRPAAAGGGDCCCSQPPPSSSQWGNELTASLARSTGGTEARPPAQHLLHTLGMLVDAMLAAKAVMARWTPYLSLHPRALLQAPAAPLLSGSWSHIRGTLQGRS